MEYGPTGLREGPQRAATHIEDPMDIAALFSLEGRRALITGSGNGIGAEYARALGQAGASVVVTDVDGDAVERTVEGLVADGIDAVGHRLDVSDITAVEACRDAVKGPVDILVNNAAIFATVPMSRAGYDALTVDEWDAMMAVNLRGTWLMARTFVPPMQQRGYGKVINISSGTALKGSSGRIHYVTTKAGVLGFTKTLAREVGDGGVSVNCIAPGSTLSEKERTDDVMQLRKAAVGTRALKRLQAPDDLLGAVVFLSAPASDFITGQTLVVDGGSAMH
jgi:3-oxoacyl-[acyl-carrier protein] reductase